MKYDFGTMYERDMDIMFLNAFASDKSFLKLFTDKTKFPKADYKVKEVYLSKSDKDGESDITVIIEAAGIKYGILIEDKIDAIDMQRQPERYTTRGETGVKNGEYSAFCVFIVCPEKYYQNNEAAKRYQHHVSYEEIQSYLKGKTDSMSLVYYQEITQAIKKAKKPPKVVIDENANRFIRAYIDYQEDNYPNLDLTTSRDVNGYWAHYRTRFGLVFLYHKISRGLVDLTFNRAAEHIDKLEMIAKWLREHGFEKISVAKTGKSGVLRIKVPTLNMDIPFEENDETDITKCFEAINEMVTAANIFALAGSISNFQKED